MADNVQVWSLEGRSRVDRKMGLILKPEDWMGELEPWTEGWVLGSPCGAGERLGKCGQCHWREPGNRCLEAEEERVERTAETDQVDLPWPMQVWGP